VIPILLAVAGLALLGIGWILLRSLGSGARVGRILAATPVIPVSRAIALADAGTTRYVAVAGRIDAENEFEDEHHRPLVFRRTRLDTRAGRSWTTVRDGREAVPFEVVDGLDRIAVDVDAIDEGLVVITRESEGTAADVPDRMPAGTPPETRVRLRVEQLSSVDHAIACGVPGREGDRGAVLRAGLGRPIIVTTLEPAEAMRLLAVGHRDTTRLVAVLFGIGLVAIVVGLGWWVVDAIL
jgi:hypothetical protein